MALEDLEAQQKRVAQAASNLTKHVDDPQTLIAKAAEIAAMTKDLEKHAKNLAAQVATKGSGDEERVVLTADQRERVAAATGVALDVLVVRDADGSFAKAMPTTTKPVIERLAARQAAELTAKKATREAIEKLVKQLKALDAPELDPVIRSIENDPTLEDLKRLQEETARLQQTGLD